jgi:two-component system chemotaxis response regulator CheB
MSKRPTPVIVISSHAEKENVFKALELGALDFVAKPTKRISPMIKEIRREVIKKVLLAKNLVPDSLHPIAPYNVQEVSKERTGQDVPLSSLEADLDSAKSDKGRLASGRELASYLEVVPKRIVALAASTGGPAALSQILTAIPPDIDAGVIVVQHMPPRFTATFAERLNRQCGLMVKEMSGVDLIFRGRVYVAPGDMCAEIQQNDDGLCVVTRNPKPSDRYIPSADRLFQSLAAVAGRDAIAVVLTGMGDDGASGALEVSVLGGLVVVEDQSTAVIPGMPRAAIENGAAKRIVPLGRIPAIIQDAVRSDNEKN